MPELKLRPPPTRVGLIKRTRILSQLDVAADVPVTSVVAPAGYGKTTLLAQYQDTLTCPTAWLTIDESDSDPVVLMSSICDALISAGLLEDCSDELKRVGSDSVLTKGINLLAAGLNGTSNGVLLMDQVDHLSTQSALDVVGAVMSKLAGQMHVVVASRTGTGLPLPRLRSQGLVTELSGEDLAMDEGEVRELFVTVGVDPENLIESVIPATEGWPVAVYLTAMAIKAGAPSPAELEVHGDDFFLAEYLGEELFDKTSETTRLFLMRSSILTRLSGPLCDFVLETEGSAETLSMLKDENLLIVPMDRTRTWYRYHSLVQDFLLSELQRQIPDEIAALHSRAATWYEDNGQPDLAIEHVQKAGDSGRFVAMVLQQGRAAYAAGRRETLSGWLTWLEETKVIRKYPEVAAFGAFARGLEGDAAAAERLALYALRDGDGRYFDDGDLGPFALMVRGSQATRGAEQALSDIRAALAAFGNQAEWFHVCLGLEALTMMAVQGAEASDPVWADSFWRSESVAAYPSVSWIAAERALIAMERDDWDAARGLMDVAMEVLTEHALERYLTSTLVLTAAARLATHDGNPEDARRLLSQAVVSRPRITVAIPIFAIHALLEMSRAFVEIADIAGARRVMRDAADIVAVRTRLGLFADQYQELKEKLASLPAGLVGPSSLTKAELRLLPLLVTHLTYPEIGERLFVSRHTIKTQAMSIYRKLGVSSRAEAVEAARDIGLLSL